MKRRNWFLILILLCSSISRAADEFSVGSHEIFDAYRSIRGMGMGNAYSAVVSDGDAVFYNPAGLAKVSGIYWTIMDPMVGVSNITDTLSNLQDLQDSSNFQSTLNSIMGDYSWVGTNAKSLFYMPFLAAGVYGTGDVSFVANNPNNPELAINYIQDTGLVVGTGFPILPGFDFGASLKRITRSGKRERYGPSTINNIVNGGGDPSALVEDLRGVKGVGYALDMGLNFHIDSIVAPTLSFVWRNIGNTKFTASSGSPEAPPSDENEMIVAAAVGFNAPFVSVTPSIEIRHLNNTDHQLGKKIHLGLELDIPFVDLRAGLHQGYYSLGAGLDLGILRVDAATWGVEVGAFPGQIEDRRYAVQLTFEFGLDLGFGDSSSGSGPGKKGRRGGGSRRGLKLRR